MITSLNTASTASRARLRLTTALAGAAFAGVAQAATIEASSRIDAVTVFPDAAQITRIVEFEAPAGAHTVVFRGLPMALDPTSLRVEGAGAGMAIGSADARVAPAKVEQPSDSVAARLKDLAGERLAVAGLIEALAARKAMIERYAQASPEKLGDSAPLDVEKWASAWKSVSEGLALTADEMRRARQRLADIDQEMAALQQSNRGPRAGAAPTRDVAVEIEAREAVKGRLTLVYQVSGASWRPVYDARLVTAGKGLPPKLELVRRAAVQQRSGEAWNGVALTLSTVRARRGTQAPDVNTRILRFDEPPPMASDFRRRDAAPVARMAPAAPAIAPQSAGALNKAAEPPPPPAPEIEASVEANAYSAQYVIPGRMDAPSDGSVRSVRIASTTIEPDLLAKVSASVDPTAYLEASFINKDEAPLLPGEVIIQRDGMFVGRGALPFVASGDKARLGFGADDGVKVTRAPLARKESAPRWLGGQRTETQDFRTSVKNLHDFPVKVLVVDRLPVSEDAAIVIEPLSTNTAPTEKIFDDKRGVMGWSFDLAPDASKDVRLGWVVRWPKDKRIAVDDQ